LADLSGRFVVGRASLDLAALGLKVASDLQIVSMQWQTGCSGPDQIPVSPPDGPLSADLCSDGVARSYGDGAEEPASSGLRHLRFWWWSGPCSGTWGRRPWKRPMFRILSGRVIRTQAERTRASANRGRRVVLERPLGSDAWFGHDDRLGCCPVRARRLLLSDLG
jgi:hypothetical protein